jgi:hypothetical protein
MMKRVHYVVGLLVFISFLDVLEAEAFDLKSRNLSKLWRTGRLQQVDTSGNNGASCHQTAPLFARTRGGTKNVPTDDTETSAKDVLSYYLVISPRMMQKTIFSILVLALTRLTIGSFRERAMSLISSSPNISGSFLLARIVQNVVLPLLSSACCAIQLIINAVAAGGCAGFNKRLGPLRPYFLSILAYATVASYDRSILWLRGTLIRWTIALLPEIVHFWNVGVGRRLQKSTSQQSLSDNTVEAVIEMTVPSMGCVACVQKIDSSLRQCDKVTEARSWLIKDKGGRAHVRALVSSDQEAQQLARTLARAVQGAGFEPCILDSVSVQLQTEREND